MGARAESTHKGVNQRSKDVTQAQQQRPESPTVTLTWHVCKYKTYYKLRQRFILKCTSDGIYVPCIIAHMDVPLVEFMYLVFTHVPGESYSRRLRSLLLYSCDVIRALINPLCVVATLHFQ